MTREKTIVRAMDILAILRAERWATATELASRLGLTPAEFGTAYRWLRTEWAPSHRAVLGGAPTRNCYTPNAITLVENVDAPQARTTVQDSLLYTVQDITSRLDNFDAAKVQGAAQLGVITPRQARAIQMLRDEAADQRDAVGRRFDKTKR